MQFIDIERVVFSRGWGRGEWKLFKEDSVSVWEGDQVLEVGGGGGLHDNVSILLANQPYAQRAKMVHFMLCMFYHNRKEKMKERKGAGCLGPVSRDIPAEAA